MQKNKTDWASRELAALWDKGNFFSGRIDRDKLQKLLSSTEDSQIPVVMFKNKDQNQTNSRPSFNIYMMEDNGNKGYRKSNNFTAQKTQSNNNQSSTEEVPDFLQ